MKRLVRSALCASTLVLAACGRPLEATKEAAAGAVFQSSRGASSRPAPVADLFNAGAMVTTTITVACPHGGNLALGMNVDLQDVSYDLGYDHCNYDGANSLHGTMHTTIATDVGPPASVGIHLSGRVDFSGTVSDFVDVDITQNVTAGDLSSPTPTVSITLDGTATTSSGTYTYVNETFVIDGSGLDPSSP